MTNHYLIISDTYQNVKNICQIIGLRVLFLIPGPWGFSPFSFATFFSKSVNSELKPCSLHGAAVGNSTFLLTRYSEQVRWQAISCWSNGATTELFRDLELWFTLALAPSLSVCPAIVTSSQPLTSRQSKREAEISGIMAKQGLYDSGRNGINFINCLRY
jgi:hypothetical protein